MLYGFMAIVSIITFLFSSQHDRAMVDLLVRPYILSLLAESSGKSQTDLATRSSRMLSEFESISSDENRDVMMDTIAMNPYSMNVLAKIRDELDRIIENAETSHAADHSVPAGNRNG